MTSVKKNIKLKLTNESLEWFVLIKTKGSIKWLNVEKQKKVKRKQKKEEEDKVDFF